MLGAIAGDVIGSHYERNSVKSKYFGLFPKEARFTDDTVLTVAIAKSILDGESYVDNIVKFARAYPNAGYGSSFWRWMQSDDHTPYNSWGNGSAMRVSPIGFAWNNEIAVLNEAAKSAEVTHNHPLLFSHRLS
jgi:ADP-ribosylglycohydrolase